MEYNQIVWEKTLFTEFLNKSLLMLRGLFQAGMTCSSGLKAVIISLHTVLIFLCDLILVTSGILTYAIIFSQPFWNKNFFLTVSWKEVV